MTYYMKTPYSELYYDREEAAGDVRDEFLLSDKANADFTAFYNAEMDAADQIADASENYSSFEEWATYKAYDLLDDAARDGAAVAYGVTIYADAETEALEERICDMIDPWSDYECRVAAFCALYHATDMVSDLVECIVNELDPPESVDELAERNALLNDIWAYKKARLEALA